MMGLLLSDSPEYLVIGDQKVAVFVVRNNVLLDYLRKTYEVE
jgi:hypothetical protein